MPTLQSVIAQYVEAWQASRYSGRTGTLSHSYKGEGMVTFLRHASASREPLPEVHRHCPVFCWCGIV